jgi:hypothetical protein
VDDLVSHRVSSIEDLHINQSRATRLNDATAPPPTIDLAERRVAADRAPVFVVMVNQLGGLGPAGRHAMGRVQAPHHTLAIDVDVEVILTRPCIICIENH